MSLSVKSREKCKRRIAEIRDGATSVLEVLSKPNIDLAKASELSAMVFESSADLSFVLNFTFIQDALEGGSDD